MGRAKRLGKYSNGDRTHRKCFSLVSSIRGCGENPPHFEWLRVKPFYVFARPTDTCPASALCPSYTFDLSAGRWPNFTRCATQRRLSAGALDGDPIATDAGMAARLCASAGDLVRIDPAERHGLGEIPRLAIGARDHLAAPG